MEYGDKVCIRNVPGHLWPDGLCWVSRYILVYIIRTFPASLWCSSDGMTKKWAWCVFGKSILCDIIVHSKHKIYGKSVWILYCFVEIMMTLHQRCTRLNILDPLPVQFWPSAGKTMRQLDSNRIQKTLIFASARFISPTSSSILFVLIIFLMVTYGNHYSHLRHCLKISPYSPSSSCMCKRYLIISIHITHTKLDS
jgi:hypothetical protein